MAPRLLPCPACARYVRTTDAACPFCAHALDSVQAEPLPPPPGRMPRAALYSYRSTWVKGALGGAMLAAAACESGGATAAYGGPPPVDPSQVPAALDAGADAGHVVPAPPYGLPSPPPQNGKP